MKRSTITAFLTVFVLALLVGCSSENTQGEEGDTSAASGSDYPKQPVQMIVAYSAGAATDSQARILTQYANEVFGQEIAIINMEGAGGSAGWNHFSQVDPDGYTLTAYNLPHVLSKPLVEDTQYSAETFKPIVNWGFDPVVFGVLPDSPYETMEDLIEDAKANPDSITVGNAGLYVGQHLGTLMLEDEAGISLKSVAFDGAADAQAALLGGQIDMQAGNLSDMHRLGDEVRVLGVAAEERHEYMPDTPTLKEMGYDVVMSTDRGVAAPQDTPPEIVETLREGFMEILNREDYQEEMKKAGADLMIMEGEELETEFKERAEKIEQLLKDAGEID